MIKVPEDSLSATVTRTDRIHDTTLKDTGTGKYNRPRCKISLAPRYTYPSGGYCPWLLSIARNTADTFIVKSTVFSYTKNKWLVHDSFGQAIVEPKDLAMHLHLDIINNLKKAFRGLLQLDTSWIDVLSTMHYEGSRLTGKLVFAHGNLLKEEAGELLCPRILVEADNDSLIFSRGNLRHISKLLAGSGGNALLFCTEDSNIYRCMGYLPEDKARLFPFQIEINGAFNWSLIHFGRRELRWIQGNPEVYEDHIMGAVRSLRQCFNLTTEEIGVYEKALNALASQKHGTSAIFVDLDSGDSILMEKRLEDLHRLRRALKAEGLPLGKPTELTKLSRMDGAFVVDVKKKNIIYLSAIVDGQAIVEGDNSRGARFNSLKNFIADISAQSMKDGKNLRAVALIFSEDGSIDAISSTELIANMALCSNTVKH